MLSGRSIAQRDVNDRLIQGGQGAPGFGLDAHSPSDPRRESSFDAALPAASTFRKGVRAGARRPRDDTARPRVTASAFGVERDLLGRLLLTELTMRTSFFLGPKPVVHAELEPCPFQAARSLRATEPVEPFKCCMFLTDDLCGVLEKLGHHDLVTDLAQRPLNGRDIERVAKKLCRLVPEALAAFGRDSDEALPAADGLIRAALWLLIARAFAVRVRAVGRFVG